MSEPTYPVGHCRPPEHTRFRKGQSGNPGGKPGPKKILKRAFDAALGDALHADKQDVKDARSRKLIEALARKVALDALDGRASAQRLVLGVLERDDDDERKAAAESGVDEDMKTLLGDRYEEYNRRFHKAVAAGSGDELLAIAREFQDIERLPQSGSS